MTSAGTGYQTGIPFLFACHVESAGVLESAARLSPHYSQINPFPEISDTEQAKDNYDQVIAQQKGFHDDGYAYARGLHCL